MNPNSPLFDTWGGHAIVAAGRGWQEICRPQELTDAPPEVCSLSIWWRQLLPAVGTLVVTGRASWTSGAGFAEANFDVPANGCHLNVPGGAQGLRIFARADGTSGEVVDIVAALALGGAAHLPPRLTQLFANGALGTRQPIPAFAAEVEVQPELPALPAVATTLLQFFPDPLIGTPPMGAMPIVAGARFSVYAGARWAAFGGVAVPACDIRAIWSLAL